MNRWYVSYPAWDALRSAKSFQAVGAWRDVRTPNTTFGDQRTTLINSMQVSSTFLPALGVKPALGRYFNDAEDNAPSDSIMLTHEFWQSELGGRQSVIGERVMTGYASSQSQMHQTVVGVVEPGFSVDGLTPDILRPIGTAAPVARQYPSASLRVIARLAPGVSVAAAGAEASAIVSAAPNSEPGSARVVRIDRTAVDVRAVLFALSAGFLTLLTFGVAPALTLARTPVNLVLTDGGREGRSSRVAGHRLIVAAQVALALVLLTGAALFSETVLKLAAVPLGFEPAGVAVASTTFTGNRMGDPTELKAAMSAARVGANRGEIFDALMTRSANARNDTVLDKLRGIPGVTHAAATSAVPFVTNPFRQTVVVEGRPEAERVEVQSNGVTEQYFSTMSIRLLSGRGFEPADVSGVRVAVVSSEFERRLFPEGAMGRRFQTVYGERFELSSDFYQIIGVVTNVKRLDPTDDDRPVFYGYTRQLGLPDKFVVRTTGDPSLILPAMRRAIDEVSPQIVVTQTSTLASRVQQAMVEERFRATLAAIFGVAALVLAAIGLYGLAARRVADRQREFGVRIALGARPADVRRLVIRDAMLIVSVGLAAGVPAAFAAAQATRTLLFGVTTTSPHILILAVVVLGAAVSLATILPARLAGRVDPIQALK